MLATRVSKAALALTLLFPAMALRPASAQVMNLIRITLPFEANIAGTTLPAGDYTIQPLNGTSGIPVLIFRGEKGKAIEVVAKQVATPDNSASPRTEVVIGTHASQPEIEKLWIQGQAVGFDFER